MKGKGDVEEPDRDDTLELAIAKHDEVRGKLENTLANMTNGELTPVETPSIKFFDAVETILYKHGDDCDACRRVRRFLRR